jgi:hypothetical protein
VVVSGSVLLEFGGGGGMNFTRETDLPGWDTAAACGG